MFNTYATGARQFVVQEAAEIIKSFLFIFLWFTPNTIVLSAFLHGAETITFFAPLFKCGNNLSLELSDLINNKFNKIQLITNKNQNRKIKLSEKNINFKLQLFEDQKKRLEDKSIECEILDISEIEDTADAYLFYPTVGETLDFIKSKNFNKINYLYRKLDQFSWQYCSKGFFNFKNYIPKIIQEFS